MENQHRMIKGNRDLSQGELDLMNRIKSKGAELLELQGELAQMLRSAEAAKQDAISIDSGAYPEQLAELQRFQRAEPLRWASIGKTDIQTGIMAMVRAVAQPEGC